MSTLITDDALAADFGITVDALHKLRLRYGWPCVRLGRKAVRFTPAQVEDIVAMQTEAAAKATPAVAVAGQTRRSARRSA